MNFSRREFLEMTALSGLAVNAATGAEIDLKSGMPMRVFGKTGARVSALILGCGSRLLSYNDEDADKAIHLALDRGITYLDTAYSYGNGKSEERVGRVMKTRRKQVWLTTKVQARKGEDAMRIVEGSLKRLQTDQIDLLHMHSLKDEADLKNAEAKDGVINTLYKLRDQKVVRFIGITCHNDAGALRLAIERNDFDCTQMALNAARSGMADGRPGYKLNPLGEQSFETMVLPVAVRKKMGITAMKVFAQDLLIPDLTPEQMLRYTLSLPIAGTTAGMPKFEYIEENVRIVKAFKPMPREEMDRISHDVVAKKKASIDHFFNNHIDC